MDSFSITPIGIAHTPFNEKFGIPRQSRLIDMPGVIELYAPFNRYEAIDGLEKVSHIWLEFVFHQHIHSEQRLSVRPPRMGGNKKVGVFATRSSYRPNHLGLSLVKLDGFQRGSQGVELHVTGIDLLNGTPIIDIKPYLPYADIASGAVNDIAAEAPEEESLLLSWNDAAREKIKTLKKDKADEVFRLITDVIQMDPRPAYKTIDAQREYGMAIFDMNIRWEFISTNVVEIFSVEPL